MIEISNEFKFHIIKILTGVTRMNNKLQTSSQSTPKEEHSQEKEAVIDDIMQLYEKLLAYTNRMEQQRAENDYLRQENQIYIDYAVNLEERIDNLSSKI